MGLTIRPIDVLNDVYDLYEIRQQPETMAYTDAIPSEEIDEFKEYLEDLVETNSHVFVAEHEGETKKVIGFSILNHYSEKRRNHCGAIFILVDANYQSKGVGTKLLEETIRYSDSYLMLIRLEMLIDAKNNNALQLYSKFGFEKEGLLNKANFSYGKYENYYLLSRISDYF